MSVVRRVPVWTAFLIVAVATAAAVTVLVVVPNRVTVTRAGAGTRVGPGPAVPTPTVTVTTTAPADFSGLYNRVQSGVVRIETVGCSDEGVGTGFLLSPTLVATVHHVVRDSVTISLSVGSQQVTGTVVGADPASDLTLVRASRPLSGYQFHLAGADPAVGARVAAIGFPVGDPITLTQGGVSAVERTITVSGHDLAGLIETDAAINPGNSGGPLLTSDGAVAGLVEAKNTGASGIAYAIPAYRAAGFFTRWASDPSSQRGVDCSSPTGPPQSSTDVGPPAGTPLSRADAVALAAAFTTYFHGIDTANYAAAWSVLSPANQGRTSFAAFAAGLSTSYDDDVRVVGVSDISPDAVTVTVTFTSLQAPSKGPDGDSCDHWTLDYRMVRANSRWLIDAATGHDGRDHTSC